LRQRKQWPIQARGRHLKGIFPPDHIFQIKDVADVATYDLTILHANTIIAVDVQTDQASTAPSVALNPKQLVTEAIHRRRQPFDEYILYHRAHAPKPKSPDYPGPLSKNW